MKSKCPPFLKYTVNELSLLMLTLLQVVDAVVPLSEMFQYVSNLRSMSKGRAQYTMELAKFEVVPTHIQNQISSKNQTAAAV